jgi:hypothetical protein
VSQQIKRLELETDRSLFRRNTRAVALTDDGEAGGLDVVLAKPLLWAAAETFDLAPGAILPLALFREHSVSRDAALDAFRNSERPWRIVYTSRSPTGVRAAALAGLAVTPLPASAVGPGLRILGELEGVPPLPDLEFAIFEKPQPAPAAAALSAALALLAHAPDRPLAAVALPSAPDGEGTYPADDARFHGLLPPCDAASGIVVSSDSAPGRTRKKAANAARRHGALGIVQDQATAEEAKALNGMKTRSGTIGSMP